MRVLLFIFIGLIGFSLVSSPASALQLLGSSVYSDAGSFKFEKAYVYYLDDGRLIKNPIDLNTFKKSVSPEYISENYTFQDILYKGWTAGGTAKLRVKVRITEFHTIPALKVNMSVESSGADLLFIELGVIIPGENKKYFLASLRGTKENFLYNGDAKWKTVLNPLAASGVKYLLLYSRGEKNTLLVTDNIYKAESYDSGNFWQGLRVWWRLYGLSNAKDKGMVFYLFPLKVCYNCSKVDINAKYGAFLKALPEQEEKGIAVHERGTTIPAFRGKNVVYIDNSDGKPFNISIYKQDSNNYEGADVLNITLVYPDGSVIKDVIPDDGYTGKGGVPGVIQKKVITVQGMKGIYTLKLTNDADMLIKQIIIPKEQVVLSGQLFPYNTEKTYFYVGDVNMFNITWQNPWRDQRIELYADGELIKEVTLNRTQAWLTSSIMVPDSEKNKMWSLKLTGTVILKFQGIKNYFSFTDKGWFDPENKRVESRAYGNEKQIIRYYFIRGNKLIYYIKNYNIANITIYKQDLNAYEGADVLNITVVTPDKKIYKYNIPDDGITNKGKKGRVMNRTIELKDKGIFTLLMENDSDMLVDVVAPEVKVVYEGQLIPYQTDPVYFYVGNVTGFEIKAVSPWRDVLPNAIKIYDENDRLIASINLTQINKWETTKIEVPVKSKNHVWKIVPQKAPYVLKLVNVLHIFAFEREDIFNPYEAITVNKNTHERTIPLIVITVIIGGISLWIRRK